MGVLRGSSQIVGAQWRTCHQVQASPGLHHDSNSQTRRLESVRKQKIFKRPTHVSRASSLLFLGSPGLQGNSVFGTRLDTHAGCQESGGRQ